MNAAPPNPAIVPSTPTGVAAAPATAVPIVSAETLRSLPLWAVGSVLVVSVLSAAIAWSTGHREWWPGLAAAALISVVSAAASVAVLRLAAGRSVEWLVTLTMGATVARMFISTAGLLVAIKVFKTPPDVTGLAISGYYAAMLLAETALLIRAATASQQAARQNVGEMHV